MREKLRRMHAWEMWLYALVWKLWIQATYRLANGPRANLLSDLWTEAKLNFGVKRLVMRQLIGNSVYMRPETFLEETKRILREAKRHNWYGSGK